MTQEEFNQQVEEKIALCTIQKDPKKPIHFYSAYIDGKLYVNVKRKTVWNNKAHVVNSLRNQSELFRFLRDSYREELVELHPDWFENWSIGRIGGAWAKEAYREIVNDLIEVHINEWWDKHVKVIEVSED